MPPLPETQRPRSRSWRESLSHVLHIGSDESASLLAQEGQHSSTSSEPASSPQAESNSAQQTYAPVSDSTPPRRQIASVYLLDALGGYLPMPDDLQETQLPSDSTSTLQSQEDPHGPIHI